MDVRTLNKIIQKLLKKFTSEWWTEVNLHTASRQPASEGMKKYSLTLYADMLEWVDRTVLDTVAARRGDSSSSISTKALAFFDGF